ncbi:Hypothetical predicted protein [Podarcis lilfordi]|uniref:Uncharacterized protein n=1 Tax=Podarcis lilfordi TaxID=74358 RepID=A0AA35P0M3_9SAUR|nr:Hypothetical predicted protein [Podarcis lilfordi]
MFGKSLVLDGVACSLGILLDTSLSPEIQASFVATSAFYQLRVVHKLWLFMYRDRLTTVAHVLVTSRLDYCNVALCGAALRFGSEAPAGALLESTQHSIVKQLYWLPITAQDSCVFIKS